MQNITLFRLENVSHLVQPDEFGGLEMDSPASEIFTDFKKHRPLTIEGDTPALDAAMLMRRSHARMKLVTDAKGEFIGTITADDLSDQNLMVKVAKGERLREVTVSEMMMPKRDILAMDIQEMERATIGDVIDTLQRSGQPHCLIVDTSCDHIRGLIAASEVERRLHVPIKIEKIPTFVDIFNNVKHPVM